MLSKASLRVGGALIAVLLAQGGLRTLAAQETSIKIAVVDLERVILMSQSGKDLQQRLEKFQQDVSAQGQAMTQEADDIRKRVAEGGQSLADEKLAELQKDYEDKMIAIRRFRDDKQREGEKMRNEGLRKIEQQLEPIFKAIRDEDGYDLILNNVPGVVVMANERVDITPKVVQKLNTTGAGG